MSEEPKKDCGCGDTATQLADKICLKIGGIAGEEAQKLCVVVTKDLREGKISVAEYAYRLSTQLREKHVDPVVVEKALTEAIQEMRKPPT